jgi:hypothetical protein
MKNKTPEPVEQKNKKRSFDSFCYKSIEERVNEFWDRNVMDELLASNVPKDIIEQKLLTILSLTDEKEFLEKSKELNLLKNNEKKNPKDTRRT